MKVKRRWPPLRPQKRRRNPELVNYRWGGFRSFLSDHIGRPYWGLGFNSAKDFASPDDVGTDRVYRVRVQVSDGTHDVPADLLVQLHEVSDGVTDVQVPVIDTLGPFTVAENETEVATLEATDAQSDALTWSLVEGGDADHFTITTDNTTYAGTLVFNEAKDFETPTMRGKTESIN